MKIFKENKVKRDTFSLNINNTFQDQADANFFGTQNIEELLCSESILNYVGFIIKYTSYPIIQYLIFHTEITLLITKAEYISLSYCLRDLILIQSIFNELNNINFVKKE